jgi:hypothetical protein
MTAIVFGAFLRGPLIILVHMSEIIAESSGPPFVGYAVLDTLTVTPS